MRVAEVLRNLGPDGSKKNLTAARSYDKKSQKSVSPLPRKLILYVWVYVCAFVHCFMLPRLEAASRPGNAQQAHPRSSPWPPTALKYSDRCSLPQPAGRPSGQKEDNGMVSGRLMLTRRHNIYIYERETSAYPGHDGFTRKSRHAWRMT